MFRSSYSRYNYNIHGKARSTFNPNKLDYVEFLHEAGYTFTDIACALQISHSTLWRRLQEEGISMNRYTDISDQDLDSIIRTYQESNPNCGQTLLCGFLRSKQKESE